MADGHTGVPRRKKMDIRFEINEKENYEYDFSFREDSYYSENQKSENLTINVKEIAEKLNKKIVYTDLEDAYIKILSSKIDKIKEKFENCRIYNFENEFNNFIRKTVVTFIFFYQLKNNKQIVQFKTGESLTIKEDDFSINLMFLNYPVFWNKQEGYNHYKIKTNTDYQFFITEISKQENDYWKLEIILTKANDERYFFGGRFKFFIKENDSLYFKYYENEMYCIKATVTKLKYNEIELSFDKGISKPLELYEIDERGYW